MATFKDSFAAARKSGKSSFTWNGKKYSTKTADDNKSSSVKPKARPSSVKPQARPEKKVRPSEMPKESLLNKGPAKKTVRPQARPEKPAAKEKTSRRAGRK